MILTKTGERISFGGFFIVLTLHSLSTLSILIACINYELVEGMLPKAVASIPFLWLLSIITLANAFIYVNAINQKAFDLLVSSQAYYVLVVMTLLLFPTYTLYVHLICNQKRTTLWNKDFLFLYKLFGVFPVINFFVMYKLVKNDLEVTRALRLYLSLSLARYIYLNYKTTTDISE